MYHDVYMQVKLAVAKHKGFTGGLAKDGSALLLKRKGVKVFDFNAGREVALTAMQGDPVHATRAYLVQLLQDISRSKLLTEEQAWMKDFCLITSSLLGSFKSKTAARLVYSYTNDTLEIVADIANVSIYLILNGLDKKITKDLTHVVTTMAPAPTTGTGE